MFSFFFWVGVVTCAACAAVVVFAMLFYVGSRVRLWFTTSLRADQIFYFLGRRYRTELLRLAWKYAKDGDIRKPLVVKYRLRNVRIATFFNIRRRFKV